ncbi:MAG: DUF1858 domain-containing protein [Candidatus Gracilibacteria bacterium]|jgi:hybrid cluster-associated redox disulfide protein|nr:DUF1858 domain-containing protein [Candidatus Gracilibacteria bacterium]
MPVTKEMTISEIISRYPESVDIFFDFGMGCVGCPASAMENVEDGARKHGLTDDEIADLMDMLNEIAESREAEEGNEPEGVEE